MQFRQLYRIETIHYTLFLAKKVSSSVLSSSASMTSALTSQLPVVSSISSTAVTVNKPHLWTIFSVLAAALFFGSILIVLLLVRKCRKNGQRNVFCSYPLHRPVQALPSEIRIGG